MDFETRKKEVGQRIKVLREKNGESQAELGKIILVSQNSISKIENGDVTLTLENQLRVAEHYNVSHDYLCTGIESDTILETLKKYIKLKYKNLSVGSESFNCPVLEINSVLFDYLVRSARAQSDSYMPNEVRDKWIEMETIKFNTRNKPNTLQDYESVVPLPEKLIYPDGEKADWKQKDLLRELNKEIKNISAEEKTK